MLDGSLELEVDGISCDSRSLEDGDLFVAIAGASYDGHSFVKEAVAGGAKAIVLERDIDDKKGLTKILVKDSRRVLSKLASRWYGDPSSQLDVIGITGTNGKTTISYLSEEILASGGLNCGLIGTVAYKVKDRSIPAGCTTPGALELQSLLGEMASQDLDCVVVEVSSHSLDQQRVRDVRFDVAIFTNLTLDHLDYHRTIEQYFDAKSRLFENLAPSALAVINLDDPYGRRLIHRTRAKVMTYGIDSSCDVRAEVKDLSLKGTEFRIKIGGEVIDVATKLIGRHNVYNALGACCVGIWKGFDLNHIAQALEGFGGVPGRLERIECGQPFEVFVDYAHTDDALRNVLGSLEGLARGRVIAVFGCGGERDVTKRPLMGEVAQRYSDYVILTSDNPRAEDPLEIVRQIEAGMVDGNYTVMLDRYLAIQEAIAMAGSGDIVIICGKGHERFQVFRDGRVPFDDREVAREILGERAYKEHRASEVSERHGRESRLSAR